MRHIVSTQNIWLAEILSLTDFGGVYYIDVYCEFLRKSQWMSKPLMLNSYFKPKRLNSKKANKINE